MTDLEKEKDEFKKVYTEIYGEHDQLWQGWKKRAELAQAEITELKQKLAQEQVRQNMWRDEKNHAIKRWHDISQECEDLKQKLARYEIPNYVLVPKNSKTVVAIENMVWQQVEASGIDEPIHRLDGWRILDAIEESLEKENAQQDS